MTTRYWKTITIDDLDSGAQLDKMLEAARALGADVDWDMDWEAVDLGESEGEEDHETELRQFNEKLDALGC